MTYLKTLRDAAMACSNVDYRALVRRTADILDATLTRLHMDPTEENMIAVNGAWASAARALKNIPPEADPNPVGGDTEPARLAA